MKTKIYAAWCGTGKTYICENKYVNAVEVEFWKYKNVGEIKQYVNDIKSYINKVDYIFISTDPEGLKLLKDTGLEITLVYPDISLRNEYLDRYIKRDSPSDFIGVFMKYWDSWLQELKKIYYCDHIVLTKGQFLKDVL